MLLREPGYADPQSYGHDFTVLIGWAWCNPFGHTLCTIVRAQAVADTDVLIWRLVHPLNEESIAYAWLDMDRRGEADALCQDLWLMVRNNGCPEVPFFTGSAPTSVFVPPDSPLVARAEPLFSVAVEMGYLELPNVGRSDVASVREWYHSVSIHEHVDGELDQMPAAYRATWYSRYDLVVKLRRQPDGGRHVLESIKHHLGALTRLEAEEFCRVLDSLTGPEIVALMERLANRPVARGERFTRHYGDVNEFERHRCALQVDGWRVDDFRVLNGGGVSATYLYNVPATIRVRSVADMEFDRRDTPLSGEGDRVGRL